MTKLLVTAAKIIANELDVSFFQTSGPSIDKPGDLAGILAGIEERSVFFIDEVHRLRTVVEDYLYSAMEDYSIDIILDKGPNSRSVVLNLNPFIS